MNTLTDVISDIRVFLYGGIRSLPLTLAGTMILLGTFTANYAMLFFLVGYLILIPILAHIFNMIVGEGILEALKIESLKTNIGDICRVTIPYETTKNMRGAESKIVLCSEWLAMMAFFFTYLFFNAYELYKYEPTDSTPDVSLTVTSTDASDIIKAQNRTTQAGFAMASIVLVGLLVIGYRIFYSGCEGTTISAIVCRIIMVGLFCYGGYWWYVFLGSIGQNRLSDLFGIANRLLAPGAVTNAPIACVPIPS